jgi:hypothetical protein
VWKRHIENPEVLYCIGLADFFTATPGFLGKFFLVNPFSSIKKLFLPAACRETPSRQGFLRCSLLKPLILLVFQDRHALKPLSRR